MQDNNQTQKIAATLESESPVTSDDSVSQTQVVDYLKQHPEFFTDNPDILAQIVVPHESGGNAVSLIERQVDVLRQQNSKLKNHLQELIAIAKDNEVANQRMHKLILSLLDSADLNSVFLVLNDLLRSEFSADVVALKLYCPAAFGQDESLFLNQESSIAAANQLVPSSAPQCGNFRQQEMALFFDDKSDKAASAALVPLAIDGERRLGILAIGSENVRRFNAEMGTMFLERLAETISHVVNRYC